MLLNLLLNAIQACGPGGKVVLGVDGGDPVRIRVTDNGCGIAPEKQKRIFEPFFSARARGDRARSVPLPELRPPLGRRHPGPERARDRVDLRGDPPLGRDG